MFSDPQKVVDQLALSPGMRVADVGSGAGFYSIPLAEAVGPTGKVYAVDVQKSLLDKLRNDAASKNVHCIETIWGDIEKSHGTKIRDNAVDLAAAVNVFFQVEDKKTLAEELKRITKPGKRVLVVDWSDSFGGLGPQIENVITAKALQEILESVGLKKEEDIQAGAHHYGMIFSKPDLMKEAQNAQVASDTAPITSNEQTQDEKSQ